MSFFKDLEGEHSTAECEVTKAYKTTGEVGIMLL